MERKSLITTPTPTTDAHNDALGRPLQAGDFVFASRGLTSNVCVVVRLTPKMIVVKSVNSKKASESRLYANEAVKLDPEDVQFWALSKGLSL